MMNLELNKKLDDICTARCKDSKSISYSYLRIFAFDRDDFEESFKEFFELDIDEIKLTESEESFEEIFGTFLEKRNARRIVKGIRDICGMEKNVYYDDCDLYELLEGASGGLSGFYFIEEIFFAEYDDSMVCYILGNNE